MLKYFVQMTIDLMSFGIIFSMLFSYLNFTFGKRGRNIFLIGAGISLALSVALSITKYNIRVDFGLISLISFFVFLSALLLTVILTFDKLRKPLRTVGDYLLFVFADIVILSMAIYILPDVLAYPFNFDLQGKSVFSTEFLYRIIGIVLGLILVFVTCLSAYKLMKKLDVKKRRAYIYAAVGVQFFYTIGKLIQLMVTKRMLRQTDFIFQIIKITLNYSKYFIIAVMISIVIMSVLVFLKNTKVTEEYSNSAQLRKIRASMRLQRRWAVCAVVCVIMAVVNLTVIDAYNNRKPQLSPVEDSVVENGNVYVSFDQVSDGHLHRFAYFTEDDIEVRFIVIKKPNSSSYGVGLDACDICGEAGYFERNGQVVCKKCDVVMNINTIGFKGGCNPIVIEYSIENGQIIVPVDELVKHKNEFK